ncbi:MAG: hypothetical protein RW306_06685 [Geobacteraceae bacterium]|nr:hypothetical protein [Geobacteraceae bacterium]
MKLNKKIQHMAVFIEFLAGSGLAIFFHLVLNNPEAAYSIFGIGLLLSLATYLLREDLDNTRCQLTSQYNQAHEITFAVAQINDPECQVKAQEILSGIKRTILLLQQGYMPLDETEYYLEGAKCTDLSLQRLKAVDPLTVGWHTRGALMNFYQSNLRALERGVTITRIFVINREEMAEPEAQKVLLAQYRDGIDVRVAFRGELPLANDISGRDINSSYDFGIYDDHMVTDVFPQSGKYYGRKTVIAAEVEKYVRLYEIIDHNSHAVTMEDERIILASEALKLAA